MLRYTTRIALKNNISKLVGKRCISQSCVRFSYNKVFDISINKRSEFWAEQAEQVVWFKKWNKVLDENDSIHPRWFDGGQLNTTYNCLDIHVEKGYGDQIAIIHDSPITGLQDKITYKELLNKVSLLAGVLSQHGVKKGDRVLIYMPMVPEAMISMLAIARLGAIHSLVFGGFAAKELGVRIAHAEPRVILCANCGIEPTRVIDYKVILDEAITLSGFAPHRCLIYNRPGYPRASMQTGGRDIDWDEALAGARLHDAVPVEANDPLYLLYTSGTTGLPKGIIRPSGGHAVVLKWSMSNIYAMKPGEVWWTASDFGWVVGHSYICYAPLLHRCTSVIYEGKPAGTPDAGQYFRVLSEHNVASLFVAPTALRSIRREDPHVEKGSVYSHPNFRTIFVAGEHCDRETLQWSMDAFRVPVLDHWWQTETGWPITATAVGLEEGAKVKQPPIGCTGKPVPGYDVKVVRKDGSNTEANPDELGRILVKLPLPPGVCTTFWKGEEQFKDTYFSKFPGYYDTMDAGYMDEKGHTFVMSRDDDVINVAGHRLSSGGLEEACLENPDLAECAVVGVKDELKGQIPLAILVTEKGVDKSEEQVVKETCDYVRQIIGPVASFKTAVVVPGLPKTRSGKIARGTIANMADGVPFKIPVTIEKAEVYDPIRKALLHIGFEAAKPVE